MDISRRDFLKYAGLSAAAIGLSASDLGLLEKALANPSAPTVLWLIGSSCTGCSMSFLNRISSVAPATATDVLVSSINLAYHPALMAAAGHTAVAAAQAAYTKGNYVLVVEGGVPTAFGGRACIGWTYQGKEYTFQEIVTAYAARASKILCVGTCASFGGIPASNTNPTAIKSVKALTAKTTINIAGCPTHPDWIVWAISQILLGNSIQLDSNGRPTALYSRNIHERCPRRGKGETKTFGVDGRCLKDLGCRGPKTRSNCVQSKWNGGVNWCIGANAPCLGCTNPTFPGMTSFYREVG